MTGRRVWHSAVTLTDTNHKENSMSTNQPDPIIRAAADEVGNRRMPAPVHWHDRGMLVATYNPGCLDCQAEVYLRYRQRRNDRAQS